MVKEFLAGYTIWGFDYLTISYLFTEIFIANEYHFQPSTNKPVIIDCGSNIGMSVLYFKKLFPDSKIIAIEANPHAFKLLSANMKINKVSNVELHNVALFDKETEVSFFIGDNIGTLLASMKSERGGNTELKVKAQKLSYYLKNAGKVDLIKMDVEGAEIDIIQDLFETASINQAKEYIIEYHHNMSEENSRLSSFLQKFEVNGFKYNIQGAFSNESSFQDLLIHFYKK